MKALHCWMNLLVFNAEATVKFDARDDDDDG